MSKVMRVLGETYVALSANKINVGILCLEK